MNHCQHSRERGPGDDTRADQQRPPTPGLCRERGGRRRGCAERGVLTQDRLLKLPQRGTRLDAELVEERTARVAVDLERIGLTSAPIQGSHQLRAQPFTERMLIDELAELADKCVVTAEREIRVDAILERCEPQLLEPVDFCSRELLVGEVVERGTAPEGERSA